MPIVFDWSYACQGNDDILPADLVVPPNSEQVFFIKLMLEVRTLQHITSRIVKELTVPGNERGLTRDSRGLIHDELDQMGLPNNAVPETGLKILCCAMSMGADLANVGRRVLPMEVVVMCIEEEQEVRPRQEPVMKLVVEAQTCPVCLVDMEVGSMASRLPCMHEFHASCIGQWFTRDRSCPTCRYNLH